MDINYFIVGGLLFFVIVLVIIGRNKNEFIIICRNTAITMFGVMVGVILASIVQNNSEKQKDKELIIQQLRTAKTTMGDYALWFNGKNKTGYGTNQIFKKLGCRYSHAYYKPKLFPISEYDFLKSNTATYILLSDIFKTNISDFNRETILLNNDYENVLGDSLKNSISDKIEKLLFYNQSLIELEIQYQNNEITLEKYHEKDII